MKKELTLWQRINAETPKFFKKVKTIAISVAGTAGLVLTAPSIYPEFVISPEIKAILINLVVAGFIAAGTAQTTKVDKP